MSDTDKLREALTWAVGFIRCNVARRGDYPDYHNAAALVDANPLITGPFQLQQAKLELLADRAGELLGTHPDYRTDGCIDAALDRYARLEKELADARQRCEGLAERVAQQSELLSRKAEAPELPEPVNTLIAYAMSCKKSNTREWMRVFADRLNAAIAATGCGSRVEWPRGAWATEFQLVVGG